MRTLHRLAAVALAASSFGVLAVPVPVFTFPDPATFAVTYGDFQSFSMPILSSAVQGYTVASTNFKPSSPYYINTANVIGEALVIGTGSGGNQNNQDLGLSGFVQNGFDFPNLVNQDALISFDTLSATQPGPVGAHDALGTWDIDLSALRQYLTVGGVQYDMMAYFNNNQTNKTAASNTLLAWAQITLKDLDTSNEVNFYFGGGSPTTGSVVSGGPVTVCFADIGGGMRTPTGQAGVTIATCPVGDGLSQSTYEHNLGQNGVAYGLFSKGINDILLNTASAYDVMSVRVAFQGLNNGFENLYIGAACVGRIDCDGVTTTVPEPGTLALLGVALMACSLSRRRLKI